jgi:hypothetical protein
VDWLLNVDIPVDVFPIQRMRRLEGGCLPILDGHDFASHNVYPGLCDQSFGVVGLSADVQYDLPKKVGSLLVELRVLRWWSDLFHKDLGDVRAHIPVFSFPLFSSAYGWLLLLVPFLLKAPTLWLTGLLIGMKRVVKPIVVPHGIINGGFGWWRFRWGAMFNFSNLAVWVLPVRVARWT